MCHLMQCIPVNDAEWESQLQKHHHETTPSSIEVLDANHSLDLDVSEVSLQMQFHISNF